jgi:hypothetical protein
MKFQKIFEELEGIKKRTIKFIKEFVFLYIFLY